jgi:hypothetical protein
MFLVMALTQKGGERLVASPTGVHCDRMWRLDWMLSILFFSFAHPSLSLTILRRTLREAAAALMNTDAAKDTEASHTPNNARVQSSVWRLYMFGLVSLNR